MSSALNDTVPEILVPALFLSKNVEPVTVDLCTGSLKLAVIKEVVGIPVAALAGLVVTTVGGVVSEGSFTVMLTVAVLLSAAPSLVLNVKLSGPR